FELGVLGLVDDTHPAFTELLEDFVMRDYVADDTVFNHCHYDLTYNAAALGLHGAQRNAVPSSRLLKARGFICLKYYTSLIYRAFFNCFNWVQYLLK
ncbi:MAG: hypothetical protein GWN96_15590, partial [candidate division Zixibacteria bacterium]|nr:hypothetical protein [candidate division Zixibacteria bacterium]